jgi:hypothetical protein
VYRINQLINLHGHNKHSTFQITPLKYQNIRDVHGHNKHFTFQITSFEVSKYKRCSSSQLTPHNARKIIEKNITIENSSCQYIPLSWDLLNQINQC